MRPLPFRSWDGTPNENNVDDMLQSLLLYSGVVGVEQVPLRLVEFCVVHIGE